MYSLLQAARHHGGLADEVSQEAHGKKEEHDLDSYPANQA
jgi:hypothetical protein